LIQAIRDIRPQDDVLRWPDDLSCGPIDTDQASARAAWWGYDAEDWNFELALNEFWGRVLSSRDELVVWFARHAADELAFFLNWVDRLNEHPYQIIDPTGRQISFTTRDGSATTTGPTKAVSILVPSALASLLGTERQLSTSERELARKQWRQLRDENAPFRIVTAQGLTSAPLDYFDPLLLKEATPDWQKMARLIAYTMVNNDEPYFQVGDHMLQTRLVALIESGTLMADGDPWDMRNCRVRLPDT